MEGRETDLEYNFLMGLRELASANIYWMSISHFYGQMTSITI